MILRDIQSELKRCRREYPVICITGPRQSGKTTLARTVFNRLPYVSFEEPLTRDLFSEDPRGFMLRYRTGAVFDEVQHVPHLLSYLQVLVDERRQTGRFIVTGSQHFGLIEKVSQSLAGRVALLELLPFSVSELQRGGWLGSGLEETLWKGAYPPVHDKGLRPDRWYANYLATYIERDVRQVAEIQNLTTFTRFLRLCAGHIGQMVNTAKIGADCGADHKTVRRYIGVLQASYVAGLVHPYYRNFRKRLIKTPKIYFNDTGLVCHLLGIQTADQLSTHPLRGALFENWVYTELVKMRVNSGERPEIFFWRTHGGQEVDFIVERQNTLYAIEVKAGAGVPPRTIGKLEASVNAWEAAGLSRWIVYGGDEAVNIRGCRLLPWRQIGKLIARGRVVARKK